MSHPAEQHRDHTNDQATLTKFYTLDELLQGNDEQFVRGAYQALLGRNVDDEGLSNYTSLLLDDKSRVELLVEIRNSDEGKARAAHVVGLAAAKTLVELLAHQDHAFISCAYQTLLGRPVDEGAFTGYGGQLKNGASRLQLLNEIRNSGEFKSRERIVNEIERIGKQGINRDTRLPEDNKTLDMGNEIPSVFPESALQLMELGNVPFIHSVYQVFLGRAADEEGLRNYLSQLQSATPRAEVIRAVSQSEERHPRLVFLRQLDGAIHDFMRQNQTIGGRAAQRRCAELDAMVEKQKINQIQTQLAAMSAQVKQQLAIFEKRAAIAGERLQGKKRIRELGQLSPLAQHIYAQLSVGLDEHEVGAY